MPTLRQLTCHVEKSPSNIALREYNTIYSDGVVSTFVGIPSAPTNFSIHLTSSGFIAEGLAMFVFIDGVAQCNRNRCDLLPPGPGVPDRDININLRVRQKEVANSDGQLAGHAWRFDKLNTAAADKVPMSSRVRKHSIGTIEVVVLRCQGVPQVGAAAAPLAQQKGKTGGKTASAENTDRITDSPAPDKAAESEKASLLGGFGGIFDGTGDWANDSKSAWGDTGPADNVWDQFQAQFEDNNDKSDKGFDGDDTTLVQLDGDSGPTGSSPQGIVINQYVNGNADAGSPLPSNVPAYRSVSAPHSLRPPNPWHIPFFAPYGYPPPYSMHDIPSFAEFEEFLAWKYGYGHANANNVFTGSKVFQKIGDGTYAAGQGQEPGWDNNSQNQNTGAGGWDNADDTANNDGWGNQSNANDRGAWGQSGGDDNKDGAWANADSKNNDNWDKHTSASRSNTGKGNDNARQSAGQDPGWNQEPPPSEKDRNSRSGDKSRRNSTKAKHEPRSSNDKPLDNPPPPAEPSSPPPAPPAPPSHHGSTSKRSAHGVPGSVLDFDPTKPYVKSYWSNWKGDMHSSRPTQEDPQPPQSNLTSRALANNASAAKTHIYPSRPASPISESVVASAKLSRQVHAGKGAPYYHSVSRPRYLDSLDSPYAVFIFKYRTNDMLEQIFGDQTKEHKFDRGRYVDRFKDSKKEDVIEELMRYKKALGVNTDSSAGSDDLEGGNEGSAVSRKTARSGRSKRND
ncbi:MAG: hypothetical protein Q9159_004021 [Coniocarpon cinnabarinum]